MRAKIKACTRGLNVKNIPKNLYVHLFVDFLRILDVHLFIDRGSTCNPNHYVVCTRKLEIVQIRRHINVCRE
jgi:hypothetical protein